MSENLETTVSVEGNPVVDLKTRPFTSEAYRYLKQNGLLRHVRWNGAGTLAEAYGEQLPLDFFEGEMPLATLGARVVCSGCGKQFEESNVMVVKREANPSADPIPGLPAEISAHIARTKSGNILYQGSTLLGYDENGKETAHSFCGPLYYNKVREDGSISQPNDRNSCLGKAMRKAKELAESHLSSEQKEKGVTVSVLPPITTDHAENILRAKAAAANRQNRRHQESEEALANRRAQFVAQAQAKEENISKVFSYGPKR